MSIRILTAEKRPTINWASGTSTEIFIYPPVSSFADRNFQFRISTATVEAEETNFTFFEGITRHLMILKGELQLIHEGHYSKLLRPFEQDTFSGEWKTRSRGKVTDFNLMLKGSSTGMLRHHRLHSGASKSFTFQSSFYFIYCFSGAVALGKYISKAGDLVQIEQESSIDLYAEDECELIEIEVNV
jgi:environmental stress-induced protein Ves